MAENTDNAFYRGINFEILFGEFMKSDLGWDGYKSRMQQKGKLNSKGAQVDIVGYRKDDRYRKLLNLGLIYFIIGVGCSVIGICILLLINNPDDTIMYSFLGLGIIGMVGGAYCIYDSEHYKQENAWVECKNRKGKATFEQVQKCIDEYSDYVASGDNEFKFVEWYFVSASGFVENALKLALDKKFICYELKDNKFEKVTYWK